MGCYVKHRVEPFLEYVRPGNIIETEMYSECCKLAQGEYKGRHDNVVRKVHCQLCRKYNLEHANKWYEHQPQGVLKNSHQQGNLGDQGGELSPPENFVRKICSVGNNRNGYLVSY